MNCGKVCGSPLLEKNEFVNTHPIVTHDAEAAHVGFKAPFLCFKVTGGTGESVSNVNMLSKHLSCQSALNFCCLKAEEGKT